MRCRDPLGRFRFSTPRSSWLSIFLLAVCLAFGARADDLPRRSNAPRESYSDVDVIYDSVANPAGGRLRSIITKPRNAPNKLPVIFVAGWLSCDSVEAPANTTDETGLVFRHLAQSPDWSLVRIDKPGVGDSEGVCKDTDFETELAGYRAAFRALKNYDFIDSNRVYILGISNGGGFAPLIPETDAEQASVRGYISVGGWVKTWFEHMIEIERRRFALLGKSPGEVTNRMKSASLLYAQWLLENKAPADIVKANADLAGLWPEDKDLDHLYGRRLKFYQDLQRLNLAAAWARVKVPALVLHGQFDWIMSHEDPELIAQFVNANMPGAARFVEVPEMGHTFQHYLSWTDAFAGKSAPFDPTVARILTDWLNAQLKKI